MLWRKLNVLDKINSGKLLNLASSARRMPPLSKGDGSVGLSKTLTASRKEMGAGFHGEVMRLRHSSAVEAFHTASDEGRSRQSSEVGRNGDALKVLAVSRSVR